MGLWQELNDFGSYDKRIPCPLCKGESEPTLIGGHFKSTCGHIFNEDNSPIGIDCFCDICSATVEKPKKKLKRKKHD